jgi:hypothetical protein
MFEILDKEFKCLISKMISDLEYDSNKYVNEVKKSMS